VIWPCGHAHFNLVAFPIGPFTTSTGKQQARYNLPFRIRVMKTAAYGLTTTLKNHSDDTVTDSRCR